MSARIDDYEKFWPFYLREHSSPTSRRLHFVGTSGFVATVLASALTNPMGTTAAMSIFAALMKDGMEREKRGFPLANLLGMIAAPTVANPVLFPAGMVFAYGCAWLGHFGFEKNRPATFQNPLWSLYSDFRMWSLMLQGKLWDGDPLAELGLEAEEPARQAAPTRFTAEA